MLGKHFGRGLTNTTNRAAASPHIGVYSASRASFGRAHTPRPLPHQSKGSHSEVLGLEKPAGFDCTTRRIGSDSVNAPSVGIWTVHVSSTCSGAILMRMTKLQVSPFRSGSVKSPAFASGDPSGCPWRCCGRESTSLRRAKSRRCWTSISRPTFGLRIGLTSHGPLFGSSRTR